MTYYKIILRYTRPYVTWKKFSGACELFFLRRPINAFITRFASFSCYAHHTPLSPRRSRVSPVQQRRAPRAHVAQHSGLIIIINLHYVRTRCFFSSSRRAKRVCLLDAHGGQTHTKQVTGRG